MIPRFVLVVGFSLVSGSSWADHRQGASAHGPVIIAKFEKRQLGGAKVLRNWTWPHSLMNATRSFNASEYSLSNQSQANHSAMAEGALKAGPLIVGTFAKHNFGAKEVSNLTRPQAAMNATSHSTVSEYDLYVRQQASGSAFEDNKRKKTESKNEQLKRRKVIDSQIEALQKAEESLNSMEERAASRLKSDVEDIDSIIMRRHLLTDRAAENDIDVNAIQTGADDLKTKVVKLRKDGKSAESTSVEAEATELTHAAATLRGSQEEVRELDNETQRLTIEGKGLDRHVQELAREREALQRQITRLKTESEHIDTVLEDQDDFSAFAGAGYDEVSSDNDPYMKEAAAAMKAVSGWDAEKLDEDAVKAREAMTGGFGNKFRAVR